MGVIKKKPYEISVWEDCLVTENDISYYKEIKLAVIGSDKMESPNRAFDPVLIENVNGEKTLTFSLAYKYYDEYTGEIVENPFYGYLINERKIKLFYNDEWNEFLIKECEESSTENIFKYTAKELFSLELAKLGYEITLDTSLNNNQGTVIELAKKVLANTDWEVDEDRSDLLTQYVQEPLYQAIVELPEGTETLQVLNLDTNELVDISNEETIYIFYSFINEKIVDNVQFIRDVDKPFIIDDDNVIKSTNYRFISSIEYEIDSDTQEVKGIKDIASIGDLYNVNQGYRLVYKIQTTYDPIMERTVEIYEAPYKDDVQQIYHFLDYNYTSSDIVVSYVTNGSNFELFESGKIQGWYNTTPTSSSAGPPVLQPIRTTTYPELSNEDKLTLIDQLTEVNGYIELKFNDTLTENYENTYFNEGFEHSASIIDHISAGEKFVLRTRYYTAQEQHGNLISGNPNTIENGGLRIIVAKYDTVEQECYLNQEALDKEGEAEETTGTSKINAYKIRPNDIVLDFDGNFELSQNIIDNGIFDEDHKRYIVDNVVQAPSTAYVYKTQEDSTEYIWSAKGQRYVLKNFEIIDNGIFSEDSETHKKDYKEYLINGVIQEPSLDYVYKEEGDDKEYIWNNNLQLYVPRTPFADYYLTTAEAKFSFNNEEMSDPNLNLGIFLYTNDNTLVSNYTYLQDIQITRYYKDGNDKIVTIGNAPTAVSNEAHHYYLKPTTQKNSKQINTYGSLSALAEEFGLVPDTISPVFNENSEKILSVQASNSNYFNILQDLCEKFECWLDIRVSHEEDGSITLDKNFNPIKKVAFREYAGKDNFAGFRNGINLTGITRNIDSNEIVTKLIVEPVQSEYSNTGSIDIQRAKSNASGQSYILNFSYFLNRGLITENQEDFNANIANYNAQFNKLNKDIRELQDEYVLISNSLTKVSSQRDTYTTLLNEAKRKYNQALAEFQQLTKWEYDEFANKYQNIEEWAREDSDKAKDYLKNDTVLDVVAQIYVTTVTINNYTGILTNLNKQYEDLSMKCYGAKEYGISTTFIPGNEEDIYPSTRVVVDDYVSGLYFELIDTNNSSVKYNTSSTERIFTVKNSLPYEFIKFLQIPNSENYNLIYYKNNKPIISDKTKIQIYDSTTGESYDRRIMLVPKKEYAEAHKGLQQEIDAKIEEKNQLEKEFYKKYSRFLQEGTWSSQDYIDPELYYFDALQVSDTSAQPKVSYTIDVLEVSQIDGLENYNFRVGDKTYIEDPDFFGYIYQSAVVSDMAMLEEGENPQVISAYSPVREEVIISEIEWHFDEPDNNTITVQNYKTRFEDLFQRISATVQTVQRNEISYPKTDSILDKSGLINSALLADSLNGIGGVGFALTTNGSVQATQDGLLIRDLLNPSNVMRLASSGLQVSIDGGSNWGTAISAEGISADVLTAGTINTQRIWVMDGDNPSFRWDKAGLNAYGFDENGNDSYDLKTYVRFDKYGLYGIKNDEDYVASSLVDVRNKAFFGITWEGFFIKNSYTDGEVSITSDDDFVVKQGNIKRIKIGAVEFDSDGAPIKYGINIRNDENQVVFDTGDDGNITISGTINALAGNFTGRVNVGEPDRTHIIIDGESNNPTISSSNYSDGAGTGWIINSEGDATFSNVSVRGAIKTAVFEYEEIQAVGGAFLFRPSSTIKTARYIPLDEPTEETDENGETYTVDYYKYVDGNKVYNDLLVTVEKPLIFTKNNWVKLSNYNELGENPAADIATYGLVHIYEISDIDSVPITTEIFEPATRENLVTENFVEVENPSGNPAELDFYEKEDNEYIPSQDEEVIEGKIYYQIEEIISSPVELGLYEKQNDEYILTLDDEAEEGKTYYSKTQVTSTPTNEIVLAGGCAILDSVSLENVAGGALIDFGSHATSIDTHGQTIDVPGEHNYGIGINSSDNYVNLPARAISLFETTIHPDATTKVTYDYQGILGTLPTLPADKVSPIYSAYMKDKQGIFTNNMYIGDKDQYLAFYKDANGDSQLRLVAKSFEILPDDSDLPIDLGDSVVEQKIQYTLSTSTEENTVEEEWRDTPYEESFGYYLWQRTYVKYAKGRIQYLPTEDGYYMSAGQPGPAGPAGEDAAVLVIDSSEGTVFRDNTGTTDLTVTIFYGSQVITNASQMHSIFGNNSYLEWEYKDNTDNWVILLVNDPRISDNGFTLSVDAEDVYNKVNFRCKLII